MQEACREGLIARAILNLHPYRASMYRGAIGGGDVDIQNVGRQHTKRFSAQISNQTALI